MHTGQQRGEKNETKISIIKELRCFSYRLRRKIDNTDELVDICIEIVAVDICLTEGPASPEPSHNCVVNHMTFPLLLRSQVLKIKS